MIDIKNPEEQQEKGESNQGVDNSRYSGSQLINNTSVKLSQLADLKNRESFYIPHLHPPLTLRLTLKAKPREYEVPWNQTKATHRISLSRW